MVTRRADVTALVLAWVYVVLRVGHSLVHLSYNRVRDRLMIYAASNVVLSGADGDQRQPAGLTLSLYPPSTLPGGSY